MKFFCRDRNCWGAFVWCAGHQIPVGPDGILETDIQDSCLQFLKNPSVYVDLSTVPKVKPQVFRKTPVAEVAREELRKEAVIEPIQKDVISETVPLVEQPEVSEVVSIQMEPEPGFKKPAKRGKR